MTDNYERCSCGARYKSKCVEESVSGSGKMCVRDVKVYNKEFDVLVDQIESESPEELQEARVWAKDFIQKWMGSV